MPRHAFDPKCSPAATLASPCSTHVEHKLLFRYTPKGKANDGLPSGPGDHYLIAALEVGQVFKYVSARA